MRNIIKLTGPIIGDVEVKKNGDVEVITSMQDIEGNKISKVVLNISKKIYKNNIFRINNDRVRTNVSGICSIVIDEGKPVIVVDVTTMNKASKSKEDIVLKEIADQKAAEKAARAAAKKIKWYDLLTDDDFKTINVDDIEIVEDIHKQLGFNIPNNYYNEFKVLKIAARKLDTGKYALVCGIRALTVAKLLDMKTIKVYITDMDNKTFSKKFRIKQ